MIFKKPYAFLIKYFKLINFILAALSIYIAYRSYNIVTFFNDYVEHNYSGNFYPGFYQEYISSFVFFVIILIIIGISVICLLFIYKKKPTKAYFSSIIYYIILYIFLVILKNIMITLETNVFTAEIARIYRDLSMLSIVPQPIFIILFLVRGFGFNLGKFNFKEDLKEMEISEQDSEEIEITINNDGFKLKRNIRRFGREFLYYIKENKFIFIIICILLLAGLSFGIYKSLPEIVDESYKQGESFKIDNITYNIEDSIITNIDYKGDSLGEKTYYVVAKLYIENNTSKEYNFDYNNFRLMINDNYIYPTKDKGGYFIDYANDYYGSKIKANSKQQYSLVYKISDTEVKRSYKIKVFNGSTLSDDLIVGKFNLVTITPIIINKILTEATVNIGEEVSFNNSNLGDTNLILSNPIITDKYVYNYEYCIKDSCTTYKDIVNLDYTKNDKTLLILDYKYNISTEVPYYKYSSTINNFIESFGKVRYIEDDEIKYGTVKDVTPNKLKDKIVLETTNNIKNISELSLAIIIRNKEYIIKLK